ncbi:MAG: glycosyltransferase [Chloroflexia bacterium]
MSRVSVIVPTLNEAAYLPGLLESLARQTRPAEEIIVADAGSTDGTAELARRYGARVVPGGNPAAGRNAGARVATGDLFFFLDADVLPSPDFLALALEEFEGRRYDVATCRMVPLGGDWFEQAIFCGANLFFLIVRSLHPYAPGFCILVRRSVHEAIGGFDERLPLGEDGDYVRRATRVGRFGVLTRTEIPVSMRRFRKEGLLQVGLKYLWWEARVLAGKSLEALPFSYEYGNFAPPQAYAARRPSGLQALQEEWETLARALRRPTLPGLDGLRNGLNKSTAQLKALQRYVQRPFAFLERLGMSLPASPALLGKAAGNRMRRPAPARRPLPTHDTMGGRATGRQDGSDGPRAEVCRQVGHDGTS